MARADTIGDRHLHIAFAEHRWDSLIILLLDVLLNSGASPKGRVVKSIATDC